MSNQNGQQNHENEENKNNEFSFYSEEVQEVLSRMPTWMERSGNVLLLLLLLLGIIVTSVIRYPDSLVVNAELLPAKPALMITAPQNLRVTQVMVADGSPVHFGSELLRAVDDSGQQQVVTAPDSGVIQYLSQIKRDDILPEAVPLFAITHPDLPPQVKLYLTETANNKIKLGQKVLIKGSSAAVLRGTVIRKSIFLTKGFYEVGVHLDEISEPVLNPQPVSATIILEERRLIQRIFHI